MSERDVPSGCPRRQRHADGGARAGDPDGAAARLLPRGGTFHGWAFAEPWTSQFRVLIPYHPGFGESGDLDGLREVHDLVLHYIELFDQLGLTGGVNLVGFSVGGLLAARFAIEQKHRLRRLVLVAPAGLRVPGIDVDDFFRIPPEELPARLVHRMDTLLPHLPTIPTTSTSSSTATARPARWRSCSGTIPSTRCCRAGSAGSTSPRSIVWGEDDRLAAGARCRVGRSPAAGDRGDVPRGRPPRARRVGRRARAVAAFLSWRRMCEALLLDVGFVIIDVTWTTIEAYEREPHADAPS